MDQINLIPDSFLRARRHRQQLHLYGAIVLIVLLAEGAWGVLTYAHGRRVGSDIKNVQQAIAAERQREVQLTSAMKEYHRLRECAAARTETETPLSATAIVALLSQLVPDTVALTHLSIEMTPMRGASAEAERKKPDNKAQPAKTPASRSTPDLVARLDLRGLATSDLEVARLVSTLSHHRLFSNVTLGASRASTVQKQTRFAFQITLDIPSPKAPAADQKRTKHENETPGKAPDSRGGRAAGDVSRGRPVS